MAENKKNVSLAQLKILLNNKDKIINVLKKWWDKSWLAPNDDTVWWNIIDRIESELNNYDWYDLNQKEIALNNLNSDYHNVMWYLSKINTKLDKKVNTVNDDLKQDIIDTRKESDEILKEITKKQVVEKQNKEKVEVDEMLWTPTTNNVIKPEPKEKVETNNMLQWRWIVFDKETWTYWFQSKDPKLGFRGWFKTVNEAMWQINEWVKWYYKDELKKWINSLWESKNVETVKWYVNKYQKDKWVSLKDKWFSDKEIEDTLYF